MYLFNKLPISVQDDLLKDFIFTEFLDLFSKNYFRIPWPKSSDDSQFLGTMFYNWDNQIYRAMMIDILNKLEPRTEPAGKILYMTIEEVQELFFIVKGSIEVGFELSRVPKYVIRLQKGGVIGIYNVTFNKKTMFHYRVKHEFHGFTIRKDNWNGTMSNPEFADLTCHIRG